MNNRGLSQGKSIKNTGVIHPANLLFGKADIRPNFNNSSQYYTQYFPKSIVSGLPAIYLLFYIE